MSAKEIKRLAIYVLYDKDGIVDDYIPFYLHELCPNISHLVVVCNGKLKDDSRRKLTQFTDDVFVRPNIGFDCGAVKDALFHYIGWDKVYEYDELLIVNDTVYGPFYPFKKVFDEMENRDVDFWGLTMQAETYDLAYHHATATHVVPEHVQSYFINVKTRLLHSSLFRRFWENLETNNLTFTDAIRKYEIAFTSYFSRNGFTYGAFVDTSDYFTADPARNYIATHIAPLDLVRKYGAPCIKKKALTNAPLIKLNYQVDTKPNAILSYIEDETNYDINLIWDNLLRTTSAYEVMEHLKLHFIVPDRIDKESVEGLFKENPRLGVLIEPKPYHSTYFGYLSRQAENSNPYWYGDHQYWYRDEVVEGIKGFAYADLPEIARRRGYYTGTVQTVEKALIRSADMEYMLTKLLDYLPKASTFFDLLNTVRLNNIRFFCREHDRIYLYGAGGEAERWAEVLDEAGIEFNGFVVSDGQPKKDELMGRPVMFVSQIIAEKDDCGLILALNPRNVSAVLPLLEEKQFKHVMVLN